MMWTPSYSGTGNMYGYTTHQKNLRAGLERAGVVMSEDSDLAIHISTPPSFEPIPGKFNVLYTMYECNEIPPPWVPKINEADLLVVPCTHNQNLFGRYTNLPIEVVWEGFKPEKFELRKREAPAPGERMLFLWVGAANPRKGWQHATLAWEAMLGNFPEMKGKVLLYMKTTQPEREERVIRVPEYDYVMDFRDWPFDELVELYQRSHAFLFPSLGEGWGLTLMEAMATGMPCIYTPFSAMTDWVPKKHAYPIRFGMRRVDILFAGTQKQYAKSFRPPAADPNIDDIIRKIRHVYLHYEEARHKGYQAGKAVRGITWDRSAAEFLEKVLPHYQAWKKQGVAA